MISEDEEDNIFEETSATHSSFASSDIRSYSLTLSVELLPGHLRRSHLLQVCHLRRRRPDQHLPLRRPHPQRLPFPHGHLSSHPYATQLPPSHMTGRRNKLILGHALLWNSFFFCCSFVLPACMALCVIAKLSKKGRRSMQIISVKKSSWVYGMLFVLCASSSCICWRSWLICCPIVGQASTESSKSGGAEEDMIENDGTRSPS